jgi:glycerol-3-phosphate dehydrogenase subunit C
MSKHLHHSPDKCTTCTTCTAYCPVSSVTDKFRGPKMMGPAFERFRLLGQVEDTSLEYCSNCKNCDISCPNGVPVSTFNMLARADYAKIHKPKLSEWFVSHGEKLAGWFSIVPGGLKNFGMNFPLTRIFLDLIGIERQAPLPNFASKSFKQRFREMGEGPKSDKKLVFFPGCFVNIYKPQIGVDLVEILRKAGYEVIVPDEFICCGLPIISNGFADEAEANAVQNSNELAKWAAQKIPVLVACPSCGLMLKQEYKELFPSVRNAGVNACDVVDACEFLTELLEKGEWKPEFTEEATTAIYHAPCHLRAQGMGKTGLELVRMLPGVGVSDADSGCCGISGSYGFKKSKYEIGMDIGKKLFDTVKASDAEHVLTECGTCQVQITHGTGKEVIHPVSLLRRRLK